MKHPLIEPLEARIAPAGVFSIVKQGDVTEGNSGQADLVYLVKLTGSITEPATVHYKTEDAPTATAATAGVDYVAITDQSVTFQPGGPTEIPVVVRVNGDTAAEPDEVVRVRIFNPSGGTLGTSFSQFANATILSDDTPSISIDTGPVLPITEGDSGQDEAVFHVTLSNAFTSTVTVDVTLTGVTATAGADFVAMPTMTLTFAPGEKSKDFPVQILGDLIHENAETFRITLSNPTNATLGTATVATGTITDNDSQPTISIESVSTPEGNSGASNAVFTVRLSNPSVDSVRVTVFSEADATAAHPASAGSDFTAQNRTLTFNPGDPLFQTFSVSIVGDAVDEFDEVFKVKLSAPSNATLDPARSEAVGTIVNDDILLSVADVSILETNGETTLTFNVTLSATPKQEVVVNFATRDGTAVSTGAGNDFDARSGALTFAAGTTTLTQPVTITIHGDLTGELDENFFLNLSSATNALITRAEATGTILNDDATLRIGDVQIVEGNAGEKLAVFTVTLDRGPQTGDVTVNVSTSDGSATTAGNDYVALPLTTLTFQPGGPTSQTVSVRVLGDRTAEDSEQFFVNLSDPSANTSIVQGRGTGTILNDDANLRIGDARIAEGANGTTEAVFTVTLENGPVGENVTVRVSTADGTGANGATTANNDYVAIPSDFPPLTFLPGETSKEVRVAINGDTTAELNETFQVKLTNASSNARIGGDTGTGTILNDDGNFITINDVTITEGDSGFSNAVFLVRLSASVSQQVTLDVTTAPGTATSSGATPDFTAVTTKVTFAGGTTQQLVSVPIRGDLIKEGTEAFSVLLSNLVVSGANVTLLKDTGIGTILDNNDPVPTVSIANRVDAEGNAGSGMVRFTATLSQPSPSAVTVSYFTHDDNGGAHPASVGGDYTAVSNGTITFAPGETTAFIDIPTVGDTVDEFDETFRLTLSSPVGATLGTAEAIGTIQNDDVTVSIGDVSIAEGNNGTTAFTFDVTLSQAPVGHSVVVNYATANSTASSTGVNPDFVSKTGSLTFAAGGAITQTVTVLVNGDARFEGNEQFFLNLLSSTDAMIVDGHGVGTILDDDPVKISILDNSITEGNANSSLGFTVSLDRVSDVDVAVKVNTQDGSALASVGTVLNDYTKITDQTFTIPAGQLTATVPVNIIGDTTDEVSETFSVKLSGATIGATFSKDTATGTINDNDLRTISVAGMSIVEGDSGMKDVTFTISLDRTATLPVTVSFATANGSAIDGQDFTGKTGTVTIPANSTSAQVTVSVTGDTAVEGNERFFLNLSNAVNGVISGTSGQAQATIVDDEAKLKLVPIGGTTVAEDGGTFVEFNVVRSGDTTQAVSVQFETKDVTTKSAGTLADYTAKTGTISFAAGSNTASGTIKIAIIGDSNFEFDDQFNVRLFNPVNAAILSSADVPGFESTTPVTITDNDVAPTLSIADPTPIQETDSGSQPMQFKVTLSAANERESVTVNWQTADGTDPATRANSQSGTGLVVDYTSAPTPLIFSPGDTEKTFNVTINGDLRDETDEEVFLVNLSSSPNAQITRGTATGTIVDNDDAPTIRFSTTATNVTEGDSGMVNATVMLTLSQISERPVSVQVTTKDGTAVSVGARPDFEARNHKTETYTLGLQPTTSFTFTIPIFGDVLDEAAESFGVTLSDAVNARITETRSTVTITDNDVAPEVLINSVRLNEGDAGTTEMIFTVSLSAVSGQEVSVDFRTLDGTGNNGASSTGALADFIASNGTLKFAPDELQKEVRVTINGDIFKETDETFSVQLLPGPVNGTIIPGADTGTGTIVTEDTDTTVGIAISDAFIAEGDSGVRTMTFRVDLSSVLTSATTFTIAAQSGTATRGDLLVDQSNAPAGVSGGDFAIRPGVTFTIAPGAKSTTVPAYVGGDGKFEATESFFIDLRNVPSTVTIAGGAARGTIFNDDARRVDSHTLQFIDVDGDLATVRVSRGTLTLGDLAFGAVNEIGGRQLQTIDFTGDTQFQDADLTVSARRQPGFNGDAQGKKGDGHVNVGAIFAASVRPDILQFVSGIDLGSVSIDGDLGRIVIGDTFATSAINSLVVRSMGRFTAENTTSLVLGPIDNLHVLGNFAGDLRVLGSQFGSIGNLQIDGTLLGGSADNSGLISFTGKIQNGYIGKIAGGTGANSGVVTGTGGVNSKIVTFRVGGQMAGGSGVGSGVISAPRILSLTLGGLAGGDGGGDNSSTLGSGVVSAGLLEKLVVKRNILGGDGNNSGQIIANSGMKTVRVGGEIRGGDGVGSGLIFSASGAEHISVFGSVIGGAGAGSGRIQALQTIENLRTGAVIGGSGENSGKIGGSSIRNLSVFGNIEGGRGNGSGGVDLTGKLGSGFIGGDIMGGNSLADSTLLKSGYVIAHRIQNLTLNGNLQSGENIGTGLALSGTIRSETSIDVLQIHGSVVGSAEVAAIIAAPGTSKRPAIRSLLIDGDLRFAEILAGYGANASVTDARGAAINADAQIGKVTIGSGLRSSSIIAGVDAGTDGFFGTNDDIPIGGTGTINNAGTVSKIAEIVIGGTVRAGTRSAGIGAQVLGSVKLLGSVIAPGQELVAGSNIRVFEVPVV